MTTPARVAAAAMIGVLAIGGAFFLFGSADQPNVGGPNPSASPSASPTSSEPASNVAATPSPGLPEGALAPGTYVATPFDSGPLPSCMSPPQPGCSESEDDSIRISITVPDGWAGADGIAVWLASEENSAPSGAAVGFSRGSWLHSDPCLTPARDAAGAQPDIVVGPSVDDFATALADHPLLDATDPVPVTLGGYSGQYVDLQLPADVTGCEYRPWEPGIYAQGPSHRWQLWILDVNGVRVVVAGMDYPGTSAEHKAELEAIVQSIQIEP